MGKAIVKINEEDFDSHEIALAKAKKALGEKCVCCILISCSEVSEDGKMEVAMHFEGDESLAAFLVENANRVFDDRISQQETK